MNDQEVRLECLQKLLQYGGRTKREVITRPTIKGETMDIERINAEFIERTGFPMTGEGRVLLEIMLGLIRASEGSTGLRMAVFEGRIDRLEHEHKGHAKAFTSMAQKYNQALKEQQNPKTLEMA